MTYTYRCPKCRKVKEADHSMKEDPAIYCHKCGQRMTRVIAGGGAVLFPMSSRTRGVT